MDDVWDDESPLSPTGVAVTVEDVEVQKEDTHLKLTETLRERLGDPGSIGGGSEPGMLHAEEPDWVGAFVGGRIAVKEVLHCLSKWPLPCFAAVNSADDLPLGEPEGGVWC